jgi:hypothetical protein
MRGSNPAGGAAASVWLVSLALTLGGAAAPPRELTIFGEWRRAPGLSTSPPGDPVGQDLTVRLTRMPQDRVQYELSFTNDSGARETLTTLGAFDGRRYPRRGPNNRGWMALSQPHPDMFRDRWGEAGVHAGAESCVLAHGGMQLVCRGFEISEAGRRFDYRDVYVRAGRSGEVGAGRRGSSPSLPRQAAR